MTMPAPNFVGGIYAEHYLHDQVTPVSTSPSGGTAMPLGSVCMTRGIYTLYGQTWDCTRDGLYIFRDPAKSFFVHRIVTPWGQPTDVYSLLSAVSYNHVHGVVDESNDYQAMSNNGIYRRWRLRCGYIAGLCAWLLPQSHIGIPSRVRNVTTLGPKNGFDDGHLVLETQHGAEWRMWDMTNGCYFRDSAGRHMSTSEFISWLNANPSGMPSKTMLSPLLSKWGSDVAPGYNWDYGRQGRLWDDPVYSEAWYRRIFQSIV